MTNSTNDERYLVQILGENYGSYTMYVIFYSDYISLLQSLLKQFPETRGFSG